MSKDRKMTKDIKKAPSQQLNKKQSAYQSDKGSVSKNEISTTKKAK
jgi:hypothetical protein